MPIIVKYQIYSGYLIHLYLCRTLDPLPDDAVEWLANVANPDCYEPGDFVSIEHSSKPDYSYI